MPGTYSQLLLHVVFSTKGRHPWINADVAPRLYPFIGGIVRDENGTLLNVGGMPDHLHLYLRWRTDETIANLMRHIKARSSKWMHETIPGLQAFAWQEGYSVFSVSKSQETAVQNYIANQSEHHKSIDFKDELLRLLEAHGVEYAPQYVLN